MSNVTFSAKKRESSGKEAAKKIRQNGRIPAVIYGRGGTASSIDVDAHEFTIGIKGISESTIVKIDIDGGGSHEAFVKNTQRNIISGNILHVDFYEVEAGQLLRTRVSVHTHGNPIGVRDGGILELPLHDIEVECYPKDLPERIDVDIGNLQVNQSIHVRDLELGGGVKLISSPDQVVALVKFAKAEAVEATAAVVDAAGPAAAEPAAAAAKPEEKKA